MQPCRSKYRRRYLPYFLTGPIHDHPVRIVGARQRPRASGCFYACAELSRSAVLGYDSINKRGYGLINRGAVAADLGMRLFGNASPSPRMYFGCRRWDELNRRHTLVSTPPVGGRRRTSLEPGGERMETVRSPTESSGSAGLESRLRNIEEQVAALKQALRVERVTRVSIHQLQGELLHLLDRQWRLAWGVAAGIAICAALGILTLIYAVLWHT